MPIAFNLSILIHGAWHLWHQVWSGNAPGALGGNLSNFLHYNHAFVGPVYCTYIVLQPVLRSKTAASTASSVLPVNWLRRGVYFSLVVYIYIDLTACTLAQEKGVAFRLFLI